MTPHAARPLGVLRTERGLPPGAAPWMLPPGYLVNPATFDFPVIEETVEGAWVDRVFRGDPALEAPLVAAARRLVERGAAAISSSCGFFVRYQRALAAAVQVPVATSSLLLLPSLLRQFPAPGKIGVLVADATRFSDEMLGLDDERDRARVVVAGVEGGTLVRNELLRPPPVTELADIETDVVGCVERLLAAHADLDALLFECTVFPCVAPTIRRMTALPVYDVTTLCRMMMGSVA